MVKWKRAVGAGLGALTLGVAVTGVAVAASVKQPSSSVGVATSQPLPAAVRDAKFINQYGQSETLGAQKGKTLFLVPLLTLCGDTCPFTSGNMIQVQAKLDAQHVSKAEVIAIDVDPYRDTLTRIKAYAKLIGANFQIWTEQGTTSTPHAPKNGSSMSSMSGSVGTGDKNANLTALEKFFGWTVQVVDQSTPPPADWMAPHEKLTYDINHSDGFWVVNSAQTVRFLSGTKPAFTGKLSKVLATFMGYKSNIYKSAVYKNGWTPAQAVQAVDWVIQS